MRTTNNTATVGLFPALGQAGTDELSYGSVDGKILNLTDSQMEFTQQSQDWSQEALLTL